MEKAFEFVCVSFENADKMDYEKFLHKIELEKIKDAAQKRKAEFFCGRLCAKLAYVKLTGKKLSFDRICVMNDCAGAPFFEDGGCFVSIAHDDGLAAAAVCNKTRLMAGLDIQKISPRATGVVYKTLTNAEKARFSEWAKEYGEDFTAAAFWVAKESMSKLLGYGFSVFGAREVSGIEQNGGLCVKFKDHKGFSVLLRRHRDFLFGFAAKDRDIEHFSEKNLEIAETPISEIYAKSIFNNSTVFC